VSPLLRGSNPYPCGSLTYRFYLIVTIILCDKRKNVNTF
jgi:hypothetical protein